MRRNAAPSTCWHTPRHASADACGGICMRVLRLGRCCQPTAAADTLCVHQALQQIFSNDKQVLVRSKTGVLLCRSAVDVRSTRRIVFDYGSADLSRGSWSETYHVETSVGTVDRSSVR